MHPVTPPSLDYVPRPEHPPSPDYVPSLEHPPSLVNVPEPEYPKYLVPSGDEAPIEDQHLPADASPTALSPGYVADSDSEEDLKEDPKEDHADYPADYPADEGDGDVKPSDGDDDDDDTNDEDEEASKDEDDDEEEEEHLALTYSSVVPVVDPVPSPGDTKAFKTDESAPTPRLPQIFVPPSQTQICRARKMIRATSPPLLLPSTSHRTDIPKAEMLPQKRACFTTPTSGFKVGESSAASAARPPGLDVVVTDATAGRLMSREVGYGITDTWC
uniref:Uncharacterized protein n=1 Tax=Tanacetum cinerariifolium TaxID=118510 RepID=A0A6L2KRV3_TANCI|nr:hypothetical protein [Tanacetum cinerariifolium]